MNRAILKSYNGVDYLIFRPKGMDSPTMIPVITKGDRKGTNFWTWNGDLEKPTVRPSVKTTYTKDDVKEVVIHYWLNDGICKCLSDCTDGNANKNLELEIQ